MPKMGTAGRRWTAAAVVMLALWASAAPTLVYPAYIASWHLETVLIGVLFATYPVALIGALLIWGNLADSVGPRRPILIGLLMLGLGTLAFLVATDLGHLIVGRALMGAGVGLSLGPATTVIATTGPAGAKTQAGFLTTVASAIGLTAGMVAGGATVQFSDDPLRAGYYPLLIAIVVATASAWFLPGPTGKLVQRWKPQPLLFPRDRYWFIAGVLAVAGAYSLGAVFLSIGAQFARESVGSVDVFINGLILAVSAVAIGVVALFARSLRPERSIPAGALTAAIAQAVMVWAGVADSLSLLLVSSLVGGAGYSLLFAGGITLITQSAPSSHRTATTSSGYLISYITQAAVVLAVGWIATAWGLDMALIVGSVVAVALVVASSMLGLRGKMPPRNAN